MLVEGPGSDMCTHVHSLAFCLNPVPRPHGWDSQGPLDPNQFPKQSPQLVGIRAAHITCPAGPAP